MRINTNHLCKIAHSPHFLQFISSLNGDLYSRFSKDLANTSGCKLLAVIVSNLVSKIKDLGYYDKLIEFLLRNHPDAVVVDSLFKDYNPKIFTIPHKIIVSWSENEVIDFCSAKFMSRYVLNGGFYYIEFLNHGEERFSNCRWELPK